MSLTKVTPSMIEGAPLNVVDFGASSAASASANTAAIQAAIDALQSGQTLVIDIDCNINAGLTVTNKSNIRITGNGSLTLVGASSGSKIFDLVGTIDSLEIDSLTLIGEGNTGYNQHGIGNASGQTVSNVRFHDLTLSNLNVGISCNADLSGSYTKAWVYNNNLTDIVGTGTGQGYGLHFARCTEFKCYSNNIDNASRHSIYVASGSNLNGIVEGNAIINHRKDVADSTLRAAINCIRVSNVSILNNKFLNCYDGQINVGHDTSTSSNCENILVSGNTVVGSKNVVPAIHIGEQGIPTSYFTQTVTVTNNAFISDNTVHNREIQVSNGRRINIEGNRVRRFNVSGSLGPAFYIGHNSFTSADSDVTGIVVRNNTATADATVASSYLVYVGSVLSASQEPATIKDNVFTNWANPFFFAAIFANLNCKLKWLYQVTVDAVSVSANGYANGNITGVFGVKPTTQVVGWPEYTLSLPIGFQFFPRNATTNTVSYFLQNPTGSAVDWPSQTFTLSMEDV